MPPTRDRFGAPINEAPRQRWLPLFSLAFGCIACSGGAGEASEVQGLLVVAIDGLRVDHVGHLGYDRATTPTLDRLAGGGVSFAQAFTSAPRGVPAHVGLLTGCDPNVARRTLVQDIAAPTERRWFIPDTVPRLAVEMLLAGRATAAFIDDPALVPLFGFDRGFEKYVESGGNPRPSDGRLTDRLLQWLRSVDRDQAWFAYLNLQDLERAWSVPRPDCEHYFERRRELNEVPPVGSSDDVFFAIPRSRWRGGSRSVGQYEAIYDGHLWCLDRELDSLFGGLRVAGLWENTTVVVVGTHGVQFGEAGLYLTSGRYSMADLRVPCIVRLAPSLGFDEAIRGTVTDRLFSLIDLTPTLLELGGVAIPMGVHGVSHAAFLRGLDTEQSRSSVVASCGMQEGCAVIDSRYCLEYLLPGKAEVASLGRSWFGREAMEEDLVVRFYDRIATPYPALGGELLGLDKPEAAVLRARALEWFENISLTRSVIQAGPSKLSSYDPEVLKRLLELGYLGQGFEPEG